MSNDKIVNQTIAQPGSTVNQDFHQTFISSEPKRTVEVPYFYPEYLGDAIFVGRDQEMKDLHALLQGNERVAIAAVGMSGVGKTTLARRYVMQYGSEYPGGVWWLSAAQLVLEVLGSVDRMGLRVELPTNWTEVQIVQHYFDRWHERLGDRKLLVIDDVVDYGEVKAFLPQQGSFQVLMTTKVKFGKPVKRLDLGVLEPEAALLLLRSHMEDDDRLDSAIEVARELCEWLGYLPLAIELVGRYLAQTGTIGSVLGQLKAKALDARSISAVPAEMDYAYNVRAAIELSWEPLSEEARRVAMVLGVFGLAPVELAWVRDCVDEEDVEEILDLELVRRSLVERKETGYRLHSLVREFLREKLAGTEDADVVRRSFAQIMTGIARTIDDTARLTMLEDARSGIPHIAEATQYAILLQEENNRITLFTRLAWFYKGGNLWQDARKWFVGCCDFAMDHFGEQHPETATSLNNLAIFYELIGEYEQAFPLYDQALKIRKTKLGSCHPDTGTVLHSLAGLYLSTGQYELALPLAKQALIITEKSLGNHHYTAQSLHNLALIYESTGQYELALPLAEKALEIFKLKLGDRHPDTALSMNCLAGLYMSTGDYDGALPLYEKALKICKLELGDQHLTTAVTLNNLAGLYNSMGDYEQALSLYESALEIKMAELGIQHPSTALSLDNLAGLYESVGEYDRALPLYESVLEVRKSALGNRHSDTATTLNNLATLYYSMGQYERALPLYEQAVDILEEVLGLEHPNTKVVQGNLRLLREKV